MREEGVRDHLLTETYKTYIQYHTKTKRGRTDKPNLIPRCLKPDTRFSLVGGQKNFVKNFNSLLSVLHFNW